jgi:methylenetetrahydrofolate reductase (NADPH)
MRNGPCGGTGDDGSCEVNRNKKCVWYRIHNRSGLLHRLSLLYNIKKIHNWNLEGTSAWLNVLKRRVDGPVWFVNNDQKKVKDLLFHDPEK